MIHTGKDRVEEDALLITLSEGAREGYVSSFSYPLPRGYSWGIVLDTPCNESMACAALILRKPRKPPYGPVRWR